MCALGIMRIINEATLLYLLWYFIRDEIEVYVAVLMGCVYVDKITVILKHSI